MEGDESSFTNFYRRRRGGDCNGWRSCIRRGSSGESERIIVVIAVLIEVTCSIREGIACNGDYGVRIRGVTGGSEERGIGGNRAGEI